jgi:hypothetical protein
MMMSSFVKVMMNVYKIYSTSQRQNKQQSWLKFFHAAKNHRWTKWNYWFLSLSKSRWRLYLTKISPKTESEDKRFLLRSDSTFDKIWLRLFHNWRCAKLGTFFSLFRWLYLVSAENEVTISIFNQLKLRMASIKRNIFYFCSLLRTVQVFYKISNVLF